MDFSVGPEWNPDIESYVHPKLTAANMEVSMAAWEPQGLSGVAGQPTVMPVPVLSPMERPHLWHTRSRFPEQLAHLHGPECG